MRRTIISPSRNANASFSILIVLAVACTAPEVRAQLTPDRTGLPLALADLSADCRTRCPESDQGRTYACQCDGERLALDADLQNNAANSLRRPAEQANFQHQLRTGRDHRVGARRRVDEQR